MIQQSFGSNYSEVLQEDREILKNVNRQLKRIFIFFAVDIFFLFFLCYNRYNILPLWFHTQTFLRIFFYISDSNSSHNFTPFAKESILYHSRFFIYNCRRSRLAYKNDIYLLFSIWRKSERVFWWEICNSVLAFYCVFGSDRTYMW